MIMGKNHGFDIFKHYSFRYHNYGYSRWVSVFRKSDKYDINFGLCEVHSFSAEDLPLSISSTVFFFFCRGCLNYFLSSWIRYWYGRVLIQLVSITLMFFFFLLTFSVPTTATPLLLWVLSYPSSSFAISFFLDLFFFLKILFCHICESFSFQ